MSKLIGESVKVCRKDGSSIAAFIWRKRLYRVDGVIGWWREPSEWWNGEAIRLFVRVGAFDSLGDRDELIQQVSKLVNLKHKAGRGARPLFENIVTEHASTIGTTLNDRKAKMMVERELLSLDLSAHPLDFYSFDSGFTKMRDLSQIATGKTVKIAGSVIRYQAPPTRNGNRVVYVIMEDGTGVADVTVFGDTQEKCGQVLFREGWLMVRGKVQRRGPKSLSSIADDLAALSVWQSHP